MNQRPHQKRRKADPARRLAYTALLAVETHGAYANLALADQLRATGMSGRDAAFATELVDGTSRGSGTWHQSETLPNSSPECASSYGWRHTRSLP